MPAALFRDIEMLCVRAVGMVRGKVGEGDLHGQGGLTYGLGNDFGFWWHLWVVVQGLDPRPRPQTKIVPPMSELRTTRPVLVSARSGGQAGGWAGHWVGWDDFWAHRARAGRPS